MNTNGPPHSERGGSNYGGEDSGGYRTWGFYNFMFNSGDRSPGFPCFRLVSHYDQV